MTGEDGFGQLGYSPARTTYVYEDELDAYLAMGFTMNQLHVIDRNKIDTDAHKKSVDNELDTLKQKKHEPLLVKTDNEEFFMEVRKMVRDILKEAVTFDNNKSFTPPPNVAQRAQEALNAVSNNKQMQTGSNDGSGLSKAKELASKQMQGFDQMRRMKSYFDTNQESYSAEMAAGKTIKDSGIVQAWELHGGDSGKDWVNQEMGSLNQSNLDTKKNLRKAGGAGVNKGMGTFDSNMMSTNNHRIHR